MSKSKKTVLVVGIIAILVSMGLMLLNHSRMVNNSRNVRERIKGSKEKIAQMQLNSIKSALEMYRLDVGTFPPTLDALVQPAPEPWDGPYFKDKKGTFFSMRDPWGNEFQYECLDGGKSYRLYLLTMPESEGTAHPEHR
jgi:hypothetical protein